MTMNVTFTYANIGSLYSLVFFIEMFQNLSKLNKMMY